MSQEFVLDIITVFLLKVIMSSPSLGDSFHPLSPLESLSEGLQSNEVLLNQGI
jgi:hypothetical protein